REVLVKRLAFSITSYSYPSKCALCVMQELALESSFHDSITLSSLNPSFGWSKQVSTLLVLMVIIVQLQGWRTPLTIVGSPATPSTMLSPPVVLSSYAPEKGWLSASVLTTGWTL